MKKVIVLFLAVIFVFGVSGTVFAQKEPVVQKNKLKVTEEVSSFELFWPIVAGKVMGEPYYFLKNLKEDVREFLIFGSFGKADYNIKLSEKRTVEAEKLYLEKKDYKNGQNVLNEAQSKREKSFTFINSAEKEGRDVVDLKNTLKSSLEKQILLLKYIETKLPDEPKKNIEENIVKINLLLPRIK